MCVANAARRDDGLATPPGDPLTSRLHRCVLLSVPLRNNVTAVNVSVGEAIDRSTADQEGAAGFRLDTDSGEAARWWMIQPDRRQGLSQRGPCRLSDVLEGEGSVYPDQTDAG